MLWGSSPLTPDSTESYDFMKYKESRDGSPYLKKITIPRGTKAQIRKDLNDIYGINQESLFLVGGSLEKQSKDQLDMIKQKVWLLTIYMTNSDQLTSEQLQQVNSMIGNRGK